MSGAPGCEKTLYPPKLDDPETPSTWDVVKEILGATVDAYKDCLCEHPLAVYYPGFNDIRAGKACGSLPWYEDWANE